jgi:hypothetical protein
MLAERKQKIYDLCVKYGKPAIHWLSAQSPELTTVWVEIDRCHHCRG